MGEFTCFFVHSFIHFVRYVIDVPNINRLCGNFELVLSKAQRGTTNGQKGHRATDGAREQQQEAPLAVEAGAIAVQSHVSVKATSLAPAHLAIQHPDS
jgi:hypothetical protein